ncbi:MAG: LarC family nickel insertion protein [Planctomycetota bacterium]
MQLAYLDCHSGLTGTMILGALLDAGMEERVVGSAVDRLAIPGLRLQVRREGLSGLAGVAVEIVAPELAEGWPDDLREALVRVDEAVPDRDVRQRVRAVLETLARARAEVFSPAREMPRIAELGGVGAIAEVVATCTALPALGITQVVCSAITVGRGWTKREGCSHASLVAMELLRGIPVRIAPVEGDLVSPVGAALLRVLVKAFDQELSMTPCRIGYGHAVVSGTTRSAALRVVLGEQPGNLETVLVLEANVDDVPAQVLGHATERLLSAGALDVYVTPVVMKKTRPGHLLTVLAPEGRADDLARVLLLETSTLGVRQHRVSRLTLERRIVTVSTSVGPVRVKEARLPDGSIRRAPEYDDLSAVARTSGRPLLELMELVRAELQRD